MDLAEIKTEMLRIGARMREAKADDALAAVCFYEGRMEALLDRVLEGR